jgi:hypothetical protein
MNSIKASFSPYKPTEKGKLWRDMLLHVLDAQKCVPPRISWPHNQVAALRSAQGKTIVIGFP